MYFVTMSNWCDMCLTKLNVHLIYLTAGECILNHNYKETILSLSTQHPYNEL